MSKIWEAHRQAHRRNFNRRFSETAENVDADDRLKPPVNWLVHTLAHVLIRGMANGSRVLSPLSQRSSAYVVELGNVPAPARSCGAADRDYGIG